MVTPYEKGYVDGLAKLIPSTKSIQTEYGFYEYLRGYADGREEAVKRQPSLFLEVSNN